MTPVRCVIIPSSLVRHTMKSERHPSSSSINIRRWNASGPISLTFITAIVVEGMLAQSTPSLLPLCTKEAVICNRPQGFQLVISVDLWATNWEAFVTLLVQKSHTNKVRFDDSRTLYCSIQEAKYLWKVHTVSMPSHLSLRTLLCVCVCVDTHPSDVSQGSLLWRQTAGPGLPQEVTGGCLERARIRVWPSSCFHIFSSPVQTIMAELTGLMSPWHSRKPVTVFS